MVLTTNNQGVAALASRMTKPAVIVAPRSNTTRLEDFEIQRKLGKGSFGVVYAVTRRRDPQERKRTYVMKQISMGPSRRDQEEAINECRVLAKLNHAHVVRYHESFVASGNRLCIVMEYAPKGTVHSLVQGAKPKTLSEDVVWRLTLQSALGLHHIHGLKILHRDIKAENIFLDKDGNAKIGDLGVAKVMTHAVDFAKTLVGTPYYLSPELCENKPYNHKSDVWSLGCVVYEMMTGSHPFNAQNQGALFVKILKGKYPPVRGVSFSPDLKELMDRCLTVNQTRRPDTAGILRSRAARAKAQTLGLTLPSDVPPPSNPREAFDSIAKVPGWAGSGGGGGGEAAEARRHRRGIVARRPRAAADRVVNGGPTETALQAVERIASARGADRMSRRVGLRPDGISGLPVGYGGAGGLAYAAARMADASSAARRPSTANDRTARSAAVIAGIAAAAAGAGQGAAAAESELRRIRAESARVAARADEAARNRAVAVDAARDAEDEASRRRKEAGDAMRAARERRREREEEERRAAAAERRRVRVAAAARVAEESRAELAAAKAEIGINRRRPSGRVAGGYDASRYETDRTPPPPPSIPPFPSRKTALPPSPLQGLAAATGADPDAAAPRRAPSSRKPIAANPGTVAPARPASAMPVERSGGVARRMSRPKSAAERREAARVADADLVAALPESPGADGVRTRDVPTGVHPFDRPDEFDEARAMAELAARHVPPKVTFEGKNREQPGEPKPARDVDVRASPAAPARRSRLRTAAGGGEGGVVDVAKARREAAEASRAAVRAAKSPKKSPKKSPNATKASSRPASAFIRRTGDIFGGARGRTRPVTARDVSDSTSSESSSSKMSPVVSSYAEAHERRTRAPEYSRSGDRIPSSPVKGKAAAAIGVARLAAAAVDHFVASAGDGNDGSLGSLGSLGAGSGSSISSEEISRAAAEAAAAARAAASVASGGWRNRRRRRRNRRPRRRATASRVTRRIATGARRRLCLETRPAAAATTRTVRHPRLSRTPGTFARDPAGAVARALRATVRALESVLGPTHRSDDAEKNGLKPFYDDEEESSEYGSEPGTDPGTPRSEYYSDAHDSEERSDSEERFVKAHGVSRGRASGGARVGDDRHGGRRGGARGSGVVRSPLRFRGQAKRGCRGRSAARAAGHARKGARAVRASV